jgi:hypothetical protein
MSPSNENANPYESPKSTPEARRRRAARLLDVWFGFFPLLTGIYYWRVFAFLGPRTVVSPVLPPEHPSHVSWPQFWLFFGAGLAMMCLWLLTAGLTCHLLKKRTSVSRKWIWYLGAFLLAPVACPGCYFALLRHSRCCTAA